MYQAPVRVFWFNGQHVTQYNVHVHNVERHSAGKLLYSRCVLAAQPGKMVMGWPLLRRCHCDRTRVTQSDRRFKRQSAFVQLQHAAAAYNKIDLHQVNRQLAQCLIEPASNDLSHHVKLIARQQRARKGANYWLRLSLDFQ